jgi:hypothetical protein
MAVAPSASYSFTARLEIQNKPGMLGRVTSVIGKAGAGAPGHHHQGPRQPSRP